MTEQAPGVTDQLLAGGWDLAVVDWVGVAVGVGDLAGEDFTE